MYIIIPVIVWGVLPTRNSFVNCSLHLAWWNILTFQLAQYNKVIKNKAHGESTGIELVMRNIFTYIYTHLQKRCNLKWKKKWNTYYTFCFLIKKCLFLIRKQKVYVFRVYFQIATFLKTGVYVYIYICIYIYIYIYIYYGTINSCYWFNGYQFL